MRCSRLNSLLYFSNTRSALLKISICSRERFKLNFAVASCVRRSFPTNLLSRVREIDFAFALETHAAPEGAAQEKRCW